MQLRQLDGRRFDPVLHTDPVLHSMCTSNSHQACFCAVGVDADARKVQGTHEVGVVEAHAAGSSKQGTAPHAMSDPVTRFCVTLCSSWLQADGSICSHG